VRLTASGRPKRCDHTHAQGRKPQAEPDEANLRRVGQEDVVDHLVLGGEGKVPAHAEVVAALGREAVPADPDQRVGLDHVEGGGHQVLAIPHGAIVLTALFDRPGEAGDERDAHCDDHEAARQRGHAVATQLSGREQADDGGHSAGEPYRARLGEQKPSEAENHDSGRREPPPAVAPHADGDGGPDEAHEQSRAVRERFDEGPAGAVTVRADRRVVDVVREDELPELERLHKRCEAEVAAETHERAKEDAAVLFGGEDNGSDEEDQERHQPDAFRELEHRGLVIQRSRTKRGPDEPQHRHQHHPMHRLEGERRSVAHGRRLEQDRGYARQQKHPVGRHVVRNAELSPLARHRRREQSSAQSPRRMHRPREIERRYHEPDSKRDERRGVRRHDQAQSGEPDDSGYDDNTRRGRAPAQPHLSSPTGPAGCRGWRDRLRARVRAGSPRTPR
jgi:hypothetical protein